MADRKSHVPTALFTSNREWRLWSLTLAVIAAIYATLGLATRLVTVIGHEPLFGFIFFVGFLLIGTAVLTQGLKTRPRGAEIGVALGVGAVYLMVFARMGMPERTHLFEYSVVGVLIYEALSERAKNGRRVRFPPLLAILATSLVGAFDECIQAILPNRVFEGIDILFNCLAGLMAVVAMVALGWARRWAGRRQPRDE